MYRNIGKKIKSLAVVMFVLLAIVSIGLGIFLLCSSFYMMPVGIVVLVAGPVLAWISSFILYGFGELIDKVSDIARGTSTCSPKEQKTNASNSYNNVVAEQMSRTERLRQLQKLRSEGLITEEEYNAKVTEL
ncbi:MAG: SHOCT domain-containing protein [Clostridia bacterium]|nr:SHOCT domain-containing protein [Clostridia bacterium]